MLGSVLALAAPPSARAGGTAAASDLAFPIWQGTSASQPALGHEVDCSAANPWFWDGGCTVTMYTRTTGANCTAEIVSNPGSGLTGEQAYRGTACIAKVEGVMFFARATATTCVFIGGNLTLVTWQSGMNSTLFSHDGTPLTLLAKPTGPYELTLTVGDLAEGPSAGHSVQFHEQFVAQFNWPVNTCTGPDVRNMNANLYDRTVDTELNGLGGYLQDTVYLQ